MRRQPNRFYIQLFFAAVALVLVGLRLANIEDVSSQIDGVVLGLLGAAFLIFVIPWDRLTTLQFGEFSLTVERMEDALSGLDIPSVDNMQVREMLIGMQEVIRRIQGTRVLWIDDNQHLLLGLRRLFRSIGVEVVPVSSSESAKEQLENDNDWNLVISDVQRGGSSYDELSETAGLSRIHEGVNFMLMLHDSADQATRALPVLFYSAYPNGDDLDRFTRPFRQLSPRSRFAFEWRGLLENAILMLSESRTRPIVVPPSKTPTRYEP